MNYYCFFWQFPEYETRMTKMRESFAWNLTNGPDWTLI